METLRFGPFTFQVGVDQREAAMLLQCVVDAQVRFLSSPLSQVANRLEQEVLVSSCHKLLDKCHVTSQRDGDAYDVEITDYH